MKFIYVLPLIFLPFLVQLQAQPNLDSLQQDWVQSLKEGAPKANYYWNENQLIFSKINTSDAESVIQMLTSKPIAGLTSYKHIQSFRHDRFRFLTAGTLRTDTDSLLVISPWRDVEGEWKKEMDVILSQQLPSMKVRSGVLDKLNEEREKWVELANQHNPEAHITATYLEDASYISNGQKSDGHQEIIDRYVYMENPNYQVDLESEQLWQVSEE
ncbi:hypothetical protein [Gracilimonas sp.]|uniref:hypothetical protein n=1 Tax=Gracilimonas sp. TaxID=1974203 RepID=UPI002870C87D|nr:hypothetical protein [Gracilimonas sp.]